MTTDEKTDDALLTRQEAHELLRREGYLIGWLSFEQICCPSKDRGPPIAHRLKIKPGLRLGRPLYDPRAVLKWAEANRLSKRSDLKISPAQAEATAA